MLMEADRVLSSARAEAEAILSAARTDAVRLREDAHRAGVAAAEEDVQDRLFALAEASIEALTRTEGKVIALAMRIAERIIGDLPEGDATRRVARQMLRVSAGVGTLRLRVNPANAAGVRAELGSLGAANPGGPEVRVVEDDTIAGDGCVMESDVGMVDATITSQLAAIERNLVAALGRREAGGADG